MPFPYTDASRDCEVVPDEPKRHNCTYLAAGALAAAISSARPALGRATDVAGLNPCKAVATRHGFISTKKEGVLQKAGGWWVGCVLYGC